MDPKIAWVKWEFICRPREVGGLGVKNWEGFNKALLGKWRWRFLAKSNDMCSRVIWARYGNRAEEGVLDVNPRDSIWWRDLYKECFEPGGEACWFDSGLKHIVGCGNLTRFWKQGWCGETPLKTRFRKLFHLSIQKNKSILEMGEWRNGSWSWSFKWRRSLSLRERNMVDELCNVVNGIPLRRNVMDSWVWKEEQEGRYTVQSAYSLIQAPSWDASDPIFQLVWSSAAPSNVCIFIWKLVQDRLPTRLNLLKRNVIHSAAEACCPLCLQEEESTDHILVGCPVAAGVWASFYRWMGVSTALPGGCRDHLQQHMILTLNDKQNAVFRVTWYAVAWTIWLHRNNVVFSGRGIQDGSLFEGAQLRAWQWLSGRAKGFNCSIYEWLMQPVLCIESV